MIKTATIPKKVESSNLWLWKPWYVYSNYKKGWFNTLPLFFPRLEKRHDGHMMYVAIHSIRKRLIDNDNHIGGCKPILDWLKQARYIWDDSPNFVLTKYTQVKGNADITNITVTDEEPK